MIKGQFNSWHQPPKRLQNNSDIVYRFAGRYGFGFDKPVRDAYVCTEMGPYNIRGRDVVLYDGKSIKRFMPHFHTSKLDKFDVLEIDAVVRALDVAIRRRWFKFNDYTSKLFGLTGEYDKWLANYINYIKRQRRKMETLRTSIVTPIIVTNRQSLMLRVMT